MGYDRQAVKALMERAKAEGRNALSPSEGRLLCEACGIAVPREAVATSAGEAARMAAAIGFPVVM